MNKETGMNKLSQNIKETLLMIADGDTGERETMALVALFAHEDGGPTPRHLQGLNEYMQKTVARTRAANSALGTELALHDVRFAADAISVAWGSDPRPMWALLLERFGARPSVWEAALAACGDDRDAHLPNVQLAARRSCYAYLAGALQSNADIGDILNVGIEQAMGRVATHKIEERDVVINDVRVTVTPKAISIYGDGDVQMNIRVVAATDGLLDHPTLCVGRRFDSTDAPYKVADALAEDGFISAANMLRFL
jgi:hypothetical protein